MITKLLPQLYKFEHQYFYGEPVNTYLIDTDNKLIFFDIPSYSSELKKQISVLAEGKEVVCILSHGSCGIEDGAVWQREIGLKIYLHEQDKEHNWLRITPDVLFSTPIDLSADVHIIHTPGHSKGSICLYHIPTQSLMSGDTLYSLDGFKLQVDSQADLNLLQYYKVKNIFPFHYHITTGNIDQQLTELTK